MSCLRYVLVHKIMHPAWDTSQLFSFTEKNWLKLHKSWTEVQSIKILEKINMCISRERPADRDPVEKKTKILLKFFSFFFPIPLLNMNTQVKLSLSLSHAHARTQAHPPFKLWHFLEVQKYTELLNLVDLNSIWERATSKILSSSTPLKYL